MSKRQRDNPDVSVRKAAKARFKQLVRSVILNMQWLSDATEETGLSLNVKKNVAMLVRQKRKIGMMTMAEKSLLRMPHSTRTVEERKKLCTIVANLACFSRFNPKLRARLVPYLKFIALTPGRHVMKEGDFPITIYFIITGEVEVSKMFFNKVTKQYESISEAIFGPGDCIGDIDVMEDAPRTNTYTATTNCELLALYDSDYTTLVQPYMKKLWEEKKEGIRALDYFKFFTPDQIVSACKFATIQQFDPLDTIYEEDLGSLSVVYFVLSGECVVLQCLHMRVSFLGNEKRFELDSVRRNASSGNLDMEHTKNFDFTEYLLSTSTLTFGAIFGLGEKMHHRNIMARTTVQCLIIPRFWLFEPAQNPGNIWQRQLLYIQSNLPTREELFHDFLKTRKWQMFRHNYVQKVLTEKANYCDTKPEDVPIVGRIVESTEYS
ncbi:GL15910 [Drosophila persimilis]|uniref:GL15910 n=1 Tax=Drosophila persimilis TaxID=7234 RepID=B4H137_DROPE|nr:GL15910 [Drosophila persimilis]